MKSWHEPTDPFERMEQSIRDEDRDRREAALEKLEREKAAEEKQRAEIAARTNANRDRWNKRALLREYEMFGVEPPWVDGDGVPTTSLSLLLKVGWEIIEVSGERRLVRQVKSKRKSDYDDES